MRNFGHIFYFWVGALVGFICSYFYLHHSLRYVHGPFHTLNYKRINAMYVLLVSRSTDGRQPTRLLRRTTAYIAGARIRIHNV